MSDSNWRERYAIVSLCALTILGGCAIIWALGQLKGHQDERREYAPQSYKESAKQRAIETCPNREPDGFIECAYEKIEASQQTAHDEQDLTAQQEAAWGSMIAASAGVLSLVTSIVGLWFLVKTIQQGQENNRISTAAYNASHRAWIKFEITKIGGFVLINNEPEFRVDVRIKNIGAVPAVSIAYYAGFSPAVDTPKHVDETIQAFENGMIDWTEGNIFPQDGVDRKITCAAGTIDLNVPIEVNCYLIARYRSAMSEECRYTSVIYKMIDARRMDGLINFMSPPYGDVLMMRPHDELATLAT